MAPQPPRGSASALPSTFVGTPVDKTQVFIGVDNQNTGIKKSQKMTLDTMEKNIEPRNSLTPLQIENITALKLVTGFSHGDLIYLKHRTNFEDQGGGYFRLDNTGSLGAAAEDGGVVVAATGPANSYWRRVINGNFYIPQWWGAVGDNVADDAAAIQAGADYLATLGATQQPPVYHFPYTVGYNVLSKITIKENIHILMDTFIIYGGSSESTGGLEIGTTDVTNADINMRLKVKRKTQSDWTDEGSIAIKLFNCISCNIEAGATDFTIGIQCMGRGKLFGHNNILLQRLTDNKIELDLTNDMGSSQGFCNENTFIGGRFGNSSTAKSTIDRIGVRFNSVTADTYNNNNVFFHPSFELQEVGGAEALPVEMRYGNQNTFHEARNESNSAVFARMFNASTENNFGVAFQTATVDDQSSSPVSRITSTRLAIEQSALRLVYDSGNIQRKAVKYNSTETHVAGLFLAASGAADTQLIKVTSLDFYVDTAFTADFANNQIDDVGHSRANGDIVYLTTDGTLPTGLGTGVLYYVINSAANDFQLATTIGGSIVPFSDVGSGTHNYVSPHRYVEFPSTRACGINIGTSVAKQFICVHDAVASFGGRVNIRCYNDDGVLLTDTAAAEVFTVDTGTDEIIDAGHTRIVNDVVQFTTDGTLPVGLSLLTDYHVISITAGTRFKVSLVKGGTTVNITGGTTDTDTYSGSHDYVKGKSTKGFAYSTTYGGDYGTGIDSNIETYFNLRPEVKRIALMLRGGSPNVLRLRGFRVFTPALDTAPPASVDYDPSGDLTRPRQEDGRHLATQVPDSGVYFAPMIVWDDSPADSQPMGWSLSADGAPGTWQNMPEYGTVKV